MNRMEGDMSDIKARMAAFQSEKTSFVIASDLDLESPIVPVPAADLMEIARQLGLDRATRNSFIRADLVFTAQTENRETIYCAVEISWTIQQYDLDRARRNAGLLQQARNRPARAIVYGSRYENDLNWDNVHFVEMIDRPQPRPPEGELC